MLLNPDRKMTKLRQLQLKCLEILDVVDRIGKEHNIKYSLCGGSVVGAHLYNSILPWDDDIDLMMTRENYNQFISIAEKELPKGYSIHNYQNSDLSTTLGFNYTKIFDDSTTLVQTNGKVMGIFIDITVYDKVPKNILKHIDFFLYKRAMAINRGKLPGYSPKNILRNFLLDTIFSNRRRYLKFAQRIIELIAKRSSHYTYRELFGCFYHINMIPYNPSVFENYSSIEFEGRTVMIVRDYIEYLQTRYNRTDFREPEEMQVPTHYKYVNFDLPYKEYHLNNNSVLSQI